MALSIPEVTIAAAIKMVRLHNELCRLESETDDHDHREFERCEACEDLLPKAKREYAKHAELWADSFANHILRMVAKEVEHEHAGQRG